jgi:uncharacterized membrane protein YwaF
MQFQMWSVWHILYILSPILILGALHFLLKNKTEKTKYIVGVIIGVISLSIITTRNIDILVRNGFDPQTIPLQVCHFGNIMVFLALVFKNKTLAALAFCLNMPFAFSSLIEAQSLANYTNFFSIRAQAYFWGHLFIVVGAVYPVLLGTIRFTLKHVLRAIVVTLMIFVVAMLMNILFNGLGHTSINYFYAFDSSGVPFGMFEGLLAPLQIMFKNSSEVFVVWDWFYTFCIMLVGIVAFALMYWFSKPIYKLAKEQK